MPYSVDGSASGISRDPTALSGPSKRELLENLNVKSRINYWNTSNEAIKDAKSQQLAYDIAKILPRSHAGVISDTNKVEYQSRSYWSNASANIEEVLKPLMNFQGTPNVHKSSEDGRIACDTSTLPEWEALALLNREPGGLYAGMAVCDSVLAYSDKDKSSTLLNTVHHRLGTGGSLSKTAIDVEQPARPNKTAAAAVINKPMHNNMFKVGSSWSFSNQCFSYSCNSYIRNDAHELASQFLSLTGVGTETKPRMLGLLRGRTPQGNIHIRPLCTHGDLTLALKEICDPETFEAAYIQLPNAFQGRGVPEGYICAEKNAYFRFHYKLNESGTWEKLCKPNQSPVELTRGTSEHRPEGRAAEAHANLKRIAQRENLQQQKLWQMIGDFLWYV